ncbi:hypothetical protein ACLI4U_13635 [Natrialbaceae archaeon A-CW2]
MTRRVTRRHILASTSLGASVGLAGCSSTLDQIRGGSSCPEVGLADVASKPANTITVDGFEAAFGDAPLAWVYDATVEDPGEDDRHPAYIERTGETTAELFVPIHPGDYMGGGAAEVVIESEDGDVSCSGLELEIEPLDPAPGTLETVVDEVEAALFQGGETFGYSPDELLSSTPTDLPPHVSSIAAGLQTIDGPDASATVRSLLAGESDHFEDGQFEEEGLAVVEAVANESGFATELSATASVLTDIDAPPSAESATQGRRRPRERIHYSHVGSKAVDRPANTTVDDDVRYTSGDNQIESPDRKSVDSLKPNSFEAIGAEPLDSRDSRPLERFAVVDPEPVDSPEITTASELDHWMDIQSRFARANQGVAEASRDFGAFVVAGAAFVPGAQGAAGAGAATLAVMDLVIDLADNQLPSTLDLMVHADPKEYDEDEDQVGWLFASSEAYSEGFSFSLPDAFGVVPGSGKVAKVTGRLMGQSQAMTKFGNAFLDFVQHSTAEVWETGESSAPIQFPPGLYGPFDLEPERDEPFFEWSFETVSQEDKAPFEFFENEWEYEPQGVGLARFSLWTDDDAFGDASGEESVDLEVHPIEVTVFKADTNVQSSIYRLHPDDELTLDLHAEVENAVDETVEWTLVTEEGPAQPYLSSGGEFNLEATFDAGMLDFSEYDRGVYGITAESTTESGPRKGRNPPRSDNVTVIVTEEDPEFRISRVSCVPLDDTHQFVALLDEERLGFDEIDWQVNGPGSLGSNGVFTPTSEGDVRIEFEYETDGGSELTDEVSFEVSEFCSNVSVTSLDSGHFNHAEGCVGYSERPAGDGPEKRLIIKTPRDDALYVEIDIFGEFPDGRNWEGEWVWEEITDESGNFDIEGYRPGETRLDLWNTSSGCSGNPFEDNTGTLEREVRVIGNESVVVYSGRLEQRIGRWDDSSDGVCTRVLVEFSNVIPAEMQDCLD